MRRIGAGDGGGVLRDAGELVARVDIECRVEIAPGDPHLVILEPQVGLVPLDVDVVLQRHGNRLAQRDDLRLARSLIVRRKLVPREGGGDGNGGQRERAADQHDGGSGRFRERHRLGIAGPARGSSSS